MKIKLLKGGYVREKNNHPISFDSEGYLTDQITNEKGTLLLPNITVTDKGIYRDIQEKRLLNLRNHSEIDPVTGLVKVIGAKSVYPEFDILTGWRGLMLNLQPRTNTFKSISDDTHNSSLPNILLITLQIREAKDNITNYFNSDIRKRVNKENLEEARSLGFSDFSPNLFSAGRVSAPINVKLRNNPNTTILASITPPSGNATSDQLMINIAGNNIKESALHEFLHRGSLGIAEPRRFEWGETELEFIRRVKDTNSFYRYKTEQLLRSRKDIPYNYRDFYDYISQPHEAAANYMELGLRAGIKPGTPFPGDKLFLQILKDMSTNPNIKGKGSLIMFANPSNLGKINFWKAITGQYYLYPFALYLINNKNESSNRINK